MLKKYFSFAAMIMLSAITQAAQLPCIPFIFSFTTGESSNPVASDGYASAFIGGLGGPYTYLWSLNAGSQTTATATNLKAGTYKVIAISQLGCVDSADVTVYSRETATPSICMVTCDTSSTNNLIIWDKSSFTDVDSVIVYREVSAFVYQRIGSVSNDSMSLFEDTARSVGPANGDPNIASYRYKIQIRDIFGSYGPLSPYHTTIYITDDGAGLFSWGIPYLIESASSPVNNYVLMCDTANVFNWTSVQIVSSVASSAIDLGFLYHAVNASWRVETDWSISCDPTRATINTSRSNIKHGMATTGVASESVVNNAILYPNPATDVLTLSMPDGVYGNISIVNLLGETVYTAFLEKNKQAASVQMDVSQFKKGFYNVVIRSSEQLLTLKLIVD
ncbi:MAG: hypothetical protein JWO09_3906 [Bacteroidetes bacterium]|nr:hypothetical protein [Bacteroidota bacterium]